MNTTGSQIAFDSKATRISLCVIDDSAIVNETRQEQQKAEVGEPEKWPDVRTYHCSLTVWLGADFSWRVHAKP